MLGKVIANVNGYVPISFHSRNVIKWLDTRGRHTSHVCWISGMCEKKIMEKVQLLDAESNILYTTFLSSEDAKQIAIGNIFFDIYIFH